MKHWRIDYSVCYMDGEVDEREATIEANNITMALGMAELNIVEPFQKDPKVQDAVIWNVGIMEDDVF